MSLNSSLFQEKKRQPATYWRRRFIALVVGLAVFAVIAWAISGALAVRPAGATTSSANSSAGGYHGHHGNGLGPGGAGSANKGTAAAASPGPSPSGTASPGHRTKASADAISNSAGRAYGEPGPCPQKDVVISLFTSQASVGPLTPPQFEVNVVSTSAATCRFNVGPKYLALVIKAGPARIWSSADCVRGQGSLVTDLQRGVPMALNISWDRQRSTPRCTAGTSQVPAGEYSATAIDGALASNTERIRV
jgi:hypothetical protein